ncbi:MAG: fused MFS/spermidine synthase [Solobacterium sp.]|nr:fused MFS/spermidine synthase [Solobacterium sp.]
MLFNELETSDITLYEYQNEENELIRVFLHKDGWHSATYVNYQKKNDLIFEYMKRFDVVFEANPSISSILMIGGGGYSYPKHIISTYPNVKMDIIENNPEAETLAFRFFYLEDLYEDYNLYDNKRLTTIIQDGREYLNTCTTMYDVIINDAYDGMMPVLSLYTLEAFQTIKEKLNDHGFFVANAPGYINLKESKFLLNTLYTLKQVFSNVHLIPANMPSSTSYTSNYVIVATEFNYHFKQEISYVLEDCEILYDRDVEERIKNYEY